METELDASPDVVWHDISRVHTHGKWMHDAEALWFTSPARSGVGTTFDCETRVGPLRMTDVMEITSWVENESMGVRHDGVVSGVGFFTLHPLDGYKTLFRWEEKLRFPWWLGGRLGEPIGAIVLERVWKKNLANLATRFRAGEFVGG